METQGQVHGPDVGSPTLVVTSYIGCQPASLPSTLYLLFVTLVINLSSTEFSAQPQQLNHSCSDMLLASLGYLLVNSPSEIGPTSSTISYLFT
jgi:hypothetical protein